MDMHAQKQKKINPAGRQPSTAHDSFRSPYPFGTSLNDTNDTYSADTLPGFEIDSPVTPRIGHHFADVRVHAAVPETIQTKLTINQPGDVYEQEAERVAEQVIQMEASASSEAPSTSQNARLGADDLFTRKEASDTSVHETASVPPLVDEVLSSGGGQPLDESTRSFMEPRFGHDFSRVRVHTDERAAESARAVNALAYTAGQDVVFGGGQYEPETMEGKKLLAHELTHVVQQKQGMVNEQATRLTSLHSLREQTASNVKSYSTGYQDTSDLLVLQRQPVMDAAPAIAPASEQKAIKAEVQTTLPGVEEAVRNLTLWLAMPSPAAHTEQIFQTLLLQKGHAEDLKAEFQKTAGRELESAFEAGLSGNDLIRAKRYLQYGTLRLADKIYFAANGAGTDEDTLYRLMPQAHQQIAELDNDLRNDYGQDYSHDEKLPDGQVSRSAGLLEDEMSGWELDQAKAYLAYGELRPVDQIRIATNRIGTDEDMLFAALEKSNKSTVRQEYQDSYNENLDELLDSEISGKDKERADLILAGALTPFDKIRLAVEGWGTDEQAIYDAISNATRDERDQLQALFNNHSSQLYKMLDDDLSEDEMDRVEALLRAGNTPLEKLRQAGATSVSDIVKTIKMSSGDTLQLYEDGFNDGNSEFRQYLNENTDESDRKTLDTIVNGSIEDRLSLSIEGIGTDEDYLFHVLEGLDDSTKQRLISNKELMDDISSDLSTSDFGKVQDLLRPTNMSVEERVASTDVQIERERSWLTDLFSNASDALSDESRELHAALDRAKADGEISPEEQKEIAHFQVQTEASLEVYKKVRDEIEDTAANILTTAAAIIIGVLSAGTLSAASIAMITAQQLARAALVSAVARVVAMKVVHGDRFDVFGADGATAFGAGAIDGVMAVVGAPIAKGLVGVATEATEKVASSAFKTLGREMLQKAVEGGLTTSGSAAFTTAANERTWSQGFLVGLGNVAESTGFAAATGAAGGAALHAAGAGVGAVRGRLFSGAAEAGEEDITRALATGETPVPEASGALKRGAEGGETPPEAGAAAPPEPETRVKPENEPPTTPKDKELLEETAPKEGSQLTSQELDAELELVAKAEPKSISDGPYVEEVELPNGHKWRRKSDGSWCRFSGPPYCLLPGQLVGLAEAETAKDFAKAFAQSITMDPELAPLLNLSGVGGDVSKLTGKELLRDLLKGEITAEEVLGRLSEAMKSFETQTKDLSERVLQVEGIEEYFKNAITNPKNLHAYDFEVEQIANQIREFPNGEFRAQLELGSVSNPSELKSGPDLVRYEEGGATLVQFKSFQETKKVLENIQEQVEKDLERLEPQGFMVPGPAGQNVSVNPTLEYVVDWSRLKMYAGEAEQIADHYEELTNDFLARNASKWNVNGQPFMVSIKISE